MLANHKTQQSETKVIPALKAIARNRNGYQKTEFMLQNELRNKRKEKPQKLILNNPGFGDCDDCILL